MTHVHEDLGAYVLGGLGAEEAERVRAHIAECDSCRAEHAQLAGLPQLLDLAVVAGSAEDALQKCVRLHARSLSSLAKAPRRAPIPQ